MATEIRGSLNAWTAGTVVALTLGVATSAAFAQATWVGDVPDGTGGFSDLWRDCLPCGGTMDPPNTGWSTDRIPGDDGPLGDPGTAAVIGPDGSVDLAGGAQLSLSTLTVEGFLNIGGEIAISDSASLTSFNLESGGSLNAAGPVGFTGTGTWNGFLEGAGGFTNSGGLISQTGDLRATLVNEGLLIIAPSINFGGTPGILDNRQTLRLDTTTANADILDNSGVGAVVTSGTVDKLGSGLSVIEAAGEQTGGTINVNQGVLRFFRGDWLFSGGSWTAANEGQIELTGNVDHELNGVSGISGQGSLLFNMNSFGTVTVSSPFTVDLQPSGSGLPHGLLLEGIGAFVDATLTMRQGGQWTSGTLSGGGLIVNQAPETDPFLILPGASKVLDANFRNKGHVLEWDSIRIPLGSEFFNAAGADLVVRQTLSTIEWNGSGRFRNAGTVRITTDTDLIVQDARFDQLDQGLVVVQGASLVLGNGGEWTGDTMMRLESSTDGQSTFTSSVLLTGGVFRFGSGTHRIESSSSLVLIEGASLEVESGATLQFSDDRTASVRLVAGSVGGPGTVVNQGLFEWRGGSIGIGGAALFRNEDELRIEPGVRELSGTIENHASVLISDVTLLGGSFVNAGVTTCHGDTSIDSGLDNHGVFEVVGRCELTGLVNQVSGGNQLTGGTWKIGRNGMLILPATVSSIGAGASIEGLEGLSGAEGLAGILGGRASVTGDLSLDGALELANGGQLEIGATLSVPNGVDNGNFQSANDFLSTTRGMQRGALTAPGIDTPELMNWGRIGPGGESKPGLFSLSGDLVMQPTATLEIDLGGSVPVDEHDRLEVMGSMAADGTVRVEVLESFYPVIGEEFVIATAGGGITGVFASIENATRPDIEWQLIEGADDIRLVVLDVETIFAGGFEG